MEINDLIADLFRALSHPLRIKILKFIGERGICVTDLCKSINEGQPQVSRALGLLKKTGLVIAKRIGKKTCYSLSNKYIIDIIKQTELIIEENEKKVLQIMKRGDR
jgi:ArsR family transcriptional regulator